MNKEQRANNGVTLVEMLIVVAIIVILASMVVGMATRIDNQSKTKSLENTFAMLESALQEYHEYTNLFPPAAAPDPNLNSETLYNGLNSIPSSRKVLEQIDSSLIADKGGTPGPEIYDPWGTVLDYRYAVGDNFPELISAGPDRSFSSDADNISSRKK